MRALLLSLPLLGCTDPCEAEAPSLELGLGTEAFRSVDDGVTAPLAWGPQGGWHVFVALAATGLKSGARAEVRLSAVIDEVATDDSLHRVPLRCDRTLGRQVAAGLELQLPFEPGVAGREATLSAAVAGPGGVDLTDTLRVRIEDADVFDTGR